MRKALGPSFQAEVREAEESPQGAPELRGEHWGGGMVAGEAGPAVLHGRGKWGPSAWQGGGRPLPSGVELFLFARLLVGPTIGLLGLLQGVAALVLLLHPV